MKRLFLICTFAIATTRFSFGQQKFDLAASMVRGVEVYQAQCISCHMESGEGLEGAFPPLAKSDYLMADKKRAAEQIIKGLTGPVTVNGIKYDGEMVPIELTDQEISDVVNYVRNTWGNKGEAIRPEEVKALRK